MLNLSYIFTYSIWSYCSCEKFQGCALPDGKENFCCICRFKLDYHLDEMNKIIDPKKIYDTYISMKKELKKCVNFHPSINEFWLYDFKFNC